MMIFKDKILQNIRREFTEKEKYSILMEDYFNMIKKVTHMQELQNKYESLRDQHKNLQSKYTKLKKNMAQTATEWLFEKMAQTPITDWYNVREQSNEIFKQQIIEAANFLPHDEQNNIKTSEQYYNETYNK